MAKSKNPVLFALCISDAEPDLQKGKVYKLLPDESGEKSKYVRIVDDSGEDYLYPARYFVIVDLPQQARRALLHAS